jgi:hypothetical protein
MSTTEINSDLTTAITRAIESRNAEAIAARYAEDATLTLLDRDNRPSSPQVLNGRDDIAAYYRDVCGRNIQHQVRDAVSSPTGLAFAQHCRYPDGTKVVCATVAVVKDGLIVRQTAVQTWD